MSLQDQEHPIFGPVISSYSRAQALDDGFLVDVSETAREAGITFPVALTRAVWDKCVEIPAGVECQDERGRLWDCLWMLRHAIRTQPPGDTLLYTVRIRNRRKAVRLDRRDDVQLKAVCGPGDTDAPCITIMLPDED